MFSKGFFPRVVKSWDIVVKINKCIHESTIHFTVCKVFSEEKKIDCRSVTKSRLVDDRYVTATEQTVEIKFRLLYLLEDHCPYSPRGHIHYKCERSSEVDSVDRPNIKYVTLEKSETFTVFNSLPNDKILD